ncbi:substrate-binding domain-containing protein [Microbacterium esteraromaticum]|uniref:GntR family transcriptional regulator n=1 Tax=Microbacterium esteraromaticum TaxID=57043 RepID=UPI0019D403C2|nr:substrate-binding domain-containing protein [Microbacterium esteraromaticum]MBN7794303.1 substrate-binding domain-containing protein [Microbacterium esteraromaticum]WDH78573.1 substrate-binding domain-containing protein [Microbacterium esteraromaticum]
MASQRSAAVRDAETRGLKFEILADQLRRGIIAGTWTAGQKLPTEQELSKETGLSLTTVRRAFDELVAERIVVRRQGAGSFVAPARPREERARRRIGVLLPDTQLYYPRVLQGIDESLSAAGASLQLATYRYDPDREDEAIAALLEAGVDGLLLAPTLSGINDPAARAQQLMALPVPVVLVERSLQGLGPADITEHVCSDHAGGAYDAVAHLARLGHRRIALLTRSRTVTEYGVVQGYLQAVTDLGLTPDLRFSQSKTEWEADSAEAAYRALRDFEATAALTFGDREAAMLEGAARRNGRHVPDDLALVSYDDEVADLAEVPLTAVAPPKYRIGRMAADVMLRRLIEGDECPLHQIRLRPRVVVRRSCGAEPASATR